MYADQVTDSMTRAINEVNRRRELQIEYNKKNKITPQQISKPIRERLIDAEIEEKIKSKKGKKLDEIDYRQLPTPELKKEIKKLEALMKYEADMLNFEEAAVYRDKAKELKKLI